MSRNFEVLERLQQDRELFRVPPLMKNLPDNGSGGNGKVSLPDPDAFAREEILRMVQYLFLATTNGNGHAGAQKVVFCGVDQANGSTLLCAQVARSLAEQVQSQVCVVDANLRAIATRSLFDLLGPDGTPQSKLDDQATTCQRVTDNLWIASRDSLAMNGSAPTLDQMRVKIKDLGDKFAFIVINAPPIGLYSDATLLGQVANGVVLVLEAHSTRRSAARKAKLALEAANVLVLGTVFNNRKFPIPEVLYRML
jgi:Mrp family chromosome partitioning ATPase